MQGMNCPLRPFDYGAVLLALAVTAVSAALVYGEAGGETEIIIQGPGSRWIFPQNAVETLAVPGPLGDTVVELRNGEARILASPCVNQTCVASGTVHAPRQWLVCLPNRVFVSVEGRDPADDSQEGGLDALAW